MLKYFVDTTEGLITATILVGLIFGFTHSAYEKTRKIPMILGLVLGILAGGVTAYLKNATKLVNTSTWTLWIFGFSLASLVLFFIFHALRKPLKKAGNVIPLLFLMIIVIGALMYALPTVLSYPYNIYLTEKSVLSTTFLTKCIGIVFGMILVFLAGLAVNRGMARLQPKTALLLMGLGLGVNAIRQITMYLRILLTKKIISNIKFGENFSIFKIVQFSSNHEQWFIFGGIFVAVAIPVILWVKSLNVNEPYNTPAEHRKIKKKWIVTKRWAALVMACLVLSGVNITVLKAVANKEVELSPVEDAEIIDGDVVVKFEQVEDGHLHRFAYVTDNNIQIRFIVIKKPNSSAYGIGLDACDICGETGYYEKDGQVVCNLCDVVMNINTIGFKGGCNPIVIPYTIENGSIRVPIAGLLEHEKEFKK
ncbi:MAG: Fe-S-containing protein [Oscillospiraceae bacterium]